MTYCERPLIECDACEGTGDCWNNNDPTSGQRCDCPTCNGTGERPVTDDEWNDLSEAAYERSLEGEPPMSLDEQHQRAWAIKHGKAW